MLELTYHDTLALVMKLRNIITLFLMFSLNITSIVSADLSITAFLQKKSRNTDDYIAGRSYVDDNSPHGVIVIEDAHCNLPIQQKIISLLKTINQEIKNAGLTETPLVLHEGAPYGNIDTSILRMYKTPTELTQYLNEKLQSGELGAAEYLHTKEDSFTFVGIEDNTLFETNYQHFMDIASKHDLLVPFIRDAEEKLGAIQNLVFSEKLLSFYSSINEGVEQNALEGHLKHLYLLALQYEVDLKQYKTLAGYFETIEALGKINVTQIEQDISRYNTTYKSTVTLNDVSGLLKSDTITMQTYPELYKYCRLKDLLTQSITIDFIKEKEALGNALLMHMAYTDEEKELVAILRTFYFFKKIVRFTLTNEEYMHYSNKLSEEKTDLNELVNYIKSYYPQLSVPFALDILLKSSKLFYTTVHQRDKALVTNIKKAFNEYNIPVATLIIGGFHTEGIIRELQENEISYLVITPKIEGHVQDSMDTYYTVMKRFWQSKHGQ